MRTALIVHARDEISSEGLARWLGSFSEVVGIIVIEEPKKRLWKRIRREWKRSGLFRFLDVLAFRLYYKIRLAGMDRTWRAEAIGRLRAAYPQPSHPPAMLSVASPNSPETVAFLQEKAPDLIIARCKSLLQKRVFSIPSAGTFVMHPGICPDYRNAHGCFWALAEGDRDNVGMTLLRIDEGIDTGPVFGHYRCEFDAAKDSHIKIQEKVVLDNLDALRDKLKEITTGTAMPVDTRGRPSREWGQPWLTAYLRWRKWARAEREASCR